MTNELAVGSVFIAAAPVTATIALILALICHRVLIAVKLYRWIWHPVLFDTALFVIFWALVSLYPLPPFLTAGNLP
ncbi:MAG TPA: DUF1656 domain-containing protein [Novosphingobium sp.]|nr:DUF1656 domain-containing protein [Novosphingobium sp.]